MKVKKWMKYTAIFLLILSVASMIWFDRLGKQIYGGLTQVVDPYQFTPQAGPVALSNVHVLSPDGDHMIAHQTILIQDGLIVEIDSLLDIPEHYRVIDGKGKYLIPGFIDAHVHLFQSPNDLLLYLANGITQIRELIGDEHHLKWKKEIEQGRIGPDMFVASPRLGSFAPMEGWFMTNTQGYMNVENAEQGKRIVKELYEQGYDGIKIYSQLTPESYTAIAETANSLNMPFFGHIPFQLGFSDIWKYGQSGVAHFEELMNALQREFKPSHGSNFGSFYGAEEEFLEYVVKHCDSLAENLLKHDIAVTSTLWLTESFVRQKYELEQVLREVELAYQNPGISEWVSFIPGGLGWLPEVNRYKMREGLDAAKRASNKKYWDAYGKACRVLATELSKRGVKIMAGTDANLPPAVPAFSFHDELRSLQNAGMSAAQVLQAATANPASWLKSNSGKISPGLSANLVLLSENPLEDISHTKSIEMVISKGQVFDRNMLDEILAAVKAANDASRTVNIDKYER